MFYTLKCLLYVIAFTLGGNMQISNRILSIASYTASSIKSGVSRGASSIGSLGRFGVSQVQSGASLVYNVARYAVNFFSNSALCVFRAAAKHPKISVTLGVAAGAATVAVVARKRFKNCCILEKVSAYNPFNSKKTEEKVEEVAAKDPVEEAVAEDVSEADVATDVETEVESSASSRSSSPSPALEKRSA